MADLPYFTPDFPGIGGKIKVRSEDFFVQEISAYEPSGEGEHVYAEIQKVGISTFDAVKQIAGALGVPGRNIGYAGMKDAHAITRQTLSIFGTTEDAVMALAIPRISVNWAIRHVNKLRLGHLKANRFAIKIREVEPTAVVRVRSLLEKLERRGMPNYFGEQRFGRRGNNDLLGAALVRGDDMGVLTLLLGGPDVKVDLDPRVRAAREAFDARENDKAMKLWPRTAGMERRVLSRLIKTSKPSAAARVVEEPVRRLWVSALQSRAFNDVVARRIESIDQVLLGDFAYKHENGACFRVEDPAAEQPRADSFEISATGPIVGYRMSEPTEEPARIEHEVLERFGLKPENFRVEGRLKVKGTRRPLRVKPSEIEVVGGADEHGPHVTVAFTLPAGSFATVLLREVMKNGEI